MKEKIKEKIFSECRKNMPLEVESDFTINVMKAIDLAIEETAKEIFEKIEEISAPEYNRPLLLTMSKNNFDIVKKEFEK